MDQLEDLSVKKTSFRALFIFIGETSDIFSFTVSLLLLVYNFEQIAMDAGRSKTELEIFDTKHHSKAR